MSDPEAPQREREKFSVDIMLAYLSIITHTFCVTCCTFLCYLIRAYIKKKPLGYQTLLDKFVIDFTWAYNLVIFMVNITGFLMTIHPIHITHNQGRIGIFLSSWIYQHFLITLMTTVIIRYLSIFHPTVIEFIEIKGTDNEVILKARMLTLATST